MTDLDTVCPLSFSWYSHCLWFPLLNWLVKNISRLSSSSPLCLLLESKGLNTNRKHSEGHHIISQLHLLIPHYLTIFELIRKQCLNSRFSSANNHIYSMSCPTTAGSAASVGNLKFFQNHFHLLCDQRLFEGVEFVWGGRRRTEGKQVTHKSLTLEDERVATVTAVAQPQLPTVVAHLSRQSRMMSASLPACM